MSEPRKPTAEDPHMLCGVLAKWAEFAPWRHVLRGLAGDRQLWCSPDDSWCSYDDPILVADLPGPCASCAELRAEVVALKREIEITNDALRIVSNERAAAAKEIREAKP